MRAPANSPTSQLGRLVLSLAALGLAASFAAAPAAAEESSDRFDASTLASYLASANLRISADVVLSDGASEPVLGSFTVDGLTYAVTGEGEAMLVAVAPATLAGGLAGDSVGAEAAADGQPGADGASLARIAGSAAAALLADGAPVPNAADAGASRGGSDDAASADDPVGPDGDSVDVASEPSTLALPGTVSFDGSEYSLTALGPRALAGCGADVVVLPPSVASVDPAALSGCAASSIEVDAANPTYSSYDGMLFDADRTSLLLIPEGKQGAARIPKTTEEVDPVALSHSGAVSSFEVEAGSAAYLSWNGCLYDASGQQLLWEPAGGESVPLADLGEAALANVEVGTKYTMILNYNGGSFQGSTSSTKEVVYGGPAWIQSPGAYRDGYQITGYWDSSGIQVYEYSADVSAGFTYPVVTAVLGTKYWSSDRKWIYPGNVTLYARWAPIHVEWYFEPNGGQLTNGQTTTLWVDGGTYDPNKTLGDFWFQDAERSGGWAFKGWYTAASGGTKVTAATKIPTNVTTKFYAQWERPTVWYYLEPNGGAFTNGQTTVLCSAHVTYDGVKRLKDVTWTPVSRTGYAFKGWYTAASGGTQVTENTLVPYNYPTYYAQWTANTITLKWDSQGGSTVANTTQSYSSGAKVTLPTAPTRAGWAFKGWWTAKTGGAQVTSSTALPTNGTMTSYARWEKRLITINAGGGYVYGGSVTDRPATYEAQWSDYWHAYDDPSHVHYRDVAGAIQILAVGRAGYTFAGWDKRVDGEHVYVTAKWTANTIRTKWDPNGGAIDGQTDTLYLYRDAVYAEGRTLADTGWPYWEDSGHFARTGHSFAGWFTAASGGAQVTAATAMPASDATYYAHWAPNRYRVSFDANGGAGGQAASVEVAYGSGSMPAISATAPVRGGYSFAGWWDAAAPAGGSMYYDAEGRSARGWAWPGDATLYARWSPLRYPVSYDAAGGSLASGGPSSYTVEDAFELPRPVRYGYAFMGWEVEGAQGAGAEDVVLADGSKATRVKAGTYGDLSCTARWALVTDVEVPVALASVGFELGVPDGAVRVAGTADAPENKAPGYLRSAMPVEVAVESVSCEAAGDGAADPAGPEGFWAAHAAFADLEVGPGAASPGEPDAAGALALTAGDAVAAPDVPSWLAIPAATGSADGTLDRMGELRLLYGLSLDRLFADPADGGAGVDIVGLLPEAAGSGFAVPTGLLRLVFTVDATSYA